MYIESLTLSTLYINTLFWLLASLTLSTLYIHTLFWLLVSLTLSALYIYIHNFYYWSIWHSQPSIYTYIILTTGLVWHSALYIHILFWLLVSLTLSALYRRILFWLLVSLTLYALYIYIHYLNNWSVWHSLLSIYTYIILTTGQFDTLRPL